MKLYKIKCPECGEIFFTPCLDPCYEDKTFYHTEVGFFQKGCDKLIKKKDCKILAIVER